MNVRFFKWTHKHRTKIHTPEIGLQRKGPSFQIIVQAYISGSNRTKDGELIIQAQKKAIKVQNAITDIGSENRAH